MLNRRLHQPVTPPTTRRHENRDGSELALFSTGVNSYRRFKIIFGIFPVTMTS